MRSMGKGHPRPIRAFEARIGCTCPTPTLRVGPLPFQGRNRKVTPATMSEPVDRPTPRRKPKREVTTIGGRTLKPSTLMMGYGYDP